MEEVLAQEAMAKRQFCKAEMHWDNVVRADPDKRWTAAASARAAGYWKGVSKYGLSRDTIIAMLQGRAGPRERPSIFSAAAVAPPAPQKTPECRTADKTVLHRRPHGYDYL